jgi:hypothetical protein
MQQARIWFGATAATAAAGLVVQLLVVATAEHSRWASIPARLFNVLCYFTIESNVIVAATCLMLAVRLDRDSRAFGSPASSGSSASRSHVPVMAVAGWLMYGPRGQASWAVVRLVLLYPLGYIAFTLVRGTVVDFYPYHFIDVATLGYAKVAANCAWIALLFLAVAGGYRRLDGWIVVR